MQRFYGGPPDAWFYLPRSLLTSYADAIDAVRAEESLSRVMDARAALPVKKSAANAHVRRLERAVRAHRRPKPANPRSLRAAGIRVERVPVKRGEG